MGLLVLAPWLLVAVAPAAAGDSCTVEGRVLGHDGKPLRNAFVGTNLRRDLRPVGGNGRFTLRLRSPGGYHLWAGGVHHQTTVVPLLIDAPNLEIDIRLRAAEYVERFDSVRVVGDFNRFSVDSALFMTRRSDGIFTATLECRSDTLWYQLLGVQKNGYSICGTHADTFRIDRSRPFISNHSGKFHSGIETGRKPVTIVFDPQALPRSSALRVVRITPSGGSAAGIVDVQAEIDHRHRRFSDAFLAHRAAGGAPESLRFDWSEDVIALAARADGERDPTLRRFRLMTYFQFAPADSDSIRARRLLRELPPDSPLWSLEWGGPANTFNRISRVAHHPDVVGAYADRVIEAHPDSNVRVSLLYQRLEEAHARNDVRAAGRYYTRLVGDFGTTPHAEWARKTFAPNRAIQKGRPVPDLVLAGLEDSSVVHRISRIRGSHLLIEFWAVWCAPCVAEMRYLHEAYEKYRGRGLEILSVSFDSRREDVVKFRKGKWKMPWLHAYVPEGFASEAAKTFEVVGIPRSILVDSEGTIVAADMELRRDGLAATLERLLPPR